MGTLRAERLRGKEVFSFEYAPTWLSSDNALDIGLAIEVAPYFRLTEARADKVIQEVKSSVQNWRVVAQRYAISKAEQELKARAFSRAL